MRCSQHAGDQSSVVGVCASCLRERLFAVIAAQCEAQAIEEEECWKCDGNHTASTFPRSVSPYVCRRKSRSRYSFSETRPPQVDAGDVAAKKKKSRFSLLSSIFRSRSDRSGPDSKVASKYTSPNRFAGNEKKKSKTRILGDPHVEEVIAYCNRHRGLSPNNEIRSDEFVHPSPSMVGYSESWKSPARPPAVPRRPRFRNASSLALCLSPLVRANPGQHWNQKVMPPEFRYTAGEARAGHRPPATVAGAFCPTPFSMRAPH